MQGTLTKLRAVLESPVAYALRVGDRTLDLNPLIGRPLVLKYTGQILCDACGRRTNKSFAQGHCYPCMTKLARCDMCVMKPETCHYAAGTCREPDWGEKHCMTDHIVYLANTSALKVGITRCNQVPTRWLDQGATQALPIARVKTRHISGLVEVAIARSVADKTNWRAILKGNGDAIDLNAAQSDALAGISDDLAAIAREHGEDTFEILEESPVDIHYPVETWPEKIKSHNFDKTPEVSGTLMGIKGQYLIFDTGVINIRKFTGYEVAVSS